MVARGNVSEFDAPTGLYRCEGEDAFVAISVAGDEDWKRLATAIDRADLADDSVYATAAGRVEHRRTLDAAVSEWTATRLPVAAQDKLQAAGVAAGAAAHVTDLIENPQIVAREQLAVLEQPGYDNPIRDVAGPALFGAIPAPDIRPAPLMAADTRAVCDDVLDLDTNEIARLIADEVLEVRAN